MQDINATAALFKGDAKAIANMAKGAGEVMLDTMILGNADGVHTKAYDEAAQRMQARLSAVGQLMAHPVDSANKGYDSMRQQLVEIDALRAQGKMNEAYEKLGELGTNGLALVDCAAGALGLRTNAVKYLGNKFTAGRIGSGSLNIFDLRTKAAEDVGQNVLNVMDGVIAKDKASVVQVFIHEDGTVSVGISGNLNVPSTANRIATLQKAMDKKYGEGIYKVGTTILDEASGVQRGVGADGWPSNAPRAVQSRKYALLRQ